MSLILNKFKNLLFLLSALVIASPAFALTLSANNAGDQVSYQNGDQNRRSLSPVAVSYSCAEQYINQGFTPIRNKVELQSMLSKPAALYKNFVLTRNIVFNDGEEFTPLGGTAGVDSFQGVFEGCNHKIVNLQILRPDETFIGLFRRNAGTIRNLILDSPRVDGGSDVGALVGRAHQLGIDVSSRIINVHVIGEGLIRGHSIVGGLVGNHGYQAFNNRPEISSSSSSVAVRQAFNSSIGRIGGLVGRNFGLIEDSFASGEVRGTWAVGGFVGMNDNNLQGYKGIIERCYSLGDVIVDYDYTLGSAPQHIGGFVGYNDRARIAESFATGTVSKSVSPVTAQYYFGGFAGTIADSTSTYLVENCYSTGQVNGDFHVGGFVGRLLGGDVRSSYTTSHIGSAQTAGGFAGLCVGFSNQVEQSYYYSIWGDVSCAGEFAELDELYDLATYGNLWDFSTIWFPASEGVLPELRNIDY